MARHILLGINSPITEHGDQLRDGSACAITVDCNRLVSVVAIQEERLSGRRYDGGIDGAVRYCLENAGPLGDAELHLAFSSALDHVWTQQAVRDFVTEHLKIRPTHVEVVDHHESHAWEAFAASPFREAVVVIIDSRGNALSDGEGCGWETQSYYVARRDSCGRISFELLGRECTETSGYGQLFRSATRYLGFPGYHHASKLMAIAGIGKAEGRNKLPLPHKFETGQLEMLVNLDPDDVYTPLRYWLEHWCGMTHLPRSEDWYSANDYRQSGRSSLRELDIELAVAVQSGYEAFLVDRVSSLVELTGIRNVCLGGGCALNCVANAQLVQRSIAENVYVGSAPSDCGQGLGNALKLLDLVAPTEMTRVSPPYFGATYSQSQVLSACEDYRERPTVIGGLASRVADELAAGRIVAVACGGSEYGPRALGNRSILASPSNHLLDTLRDIKSREDYQPFAVSVTDSLASHLFRLAPASPYMSFAPVIDGVDKAAISPVIHDDGTCRVQTVDRWRNPLLHDILIRFHALTGIPALINTSLNLRGEPIAESPWDALRLWQRAKGIDGLVLGDVFLTRTIR